MRCLLVYATKNRKGNTGIAEGKPYTLVRVFCPNDQWNLCLVNNSGLVIFINKILFVTKRESLCIHFVSDNDTDRNSIKRLINITLRLLI